MNKSVRVNKDIYTEISRAVRDQGLCSRAAIAQYLNRSPATVGRAVDQLIAARLLIETGERSRSGVGRPSQLLKFNARIGSVLTVDLRSTEVYAAITDMAGDILLTTIRDITAREAARSIEEIKDTIHSLLRDANEFPPIVGIVIGAPSLVNTEEGIIEWAYSLGWRDIPLRQILEAEFQLPVVIENDVNLAALGEFWKGAGKHNIRNLLFVSVGTGVGAGIVINGELYSGATHAAGEVAYFITDVNILRENAIKIGNLESRVGRDGLIQRARLVAQRYPLSRLADLFSREGAAIRTQDILALAEDGEAAASVVYKDVVDILTIVICNSAVLLDPDMIVLGGPSDWNWVSLIKTIKECVGSNLLRPINLVPSELGNNALVLGGSYIALNLLPQLR